MGDGVKATIILSPEGARGPGGPWSGLKEISFLEQLIWRVQN